MRLITINHSGRNSSAAVDRLVGLMHCLSEDQCHSFLPVPLAPASQHGAAQAQGPLTRPPHRAPSEGPLTGPPHRAPSHGHLTRPPHTAPSHGLLTRPLHTAPHRAPSQGPPGDTTLPTYLLVSLCIYHRCDGICYASVYHLPCKKSNYGPALFNSDGLSYSIPRWPTDRPHASTRPLKCRHRVPGSPSHPPLSSPDLDLTVPQLNVCVCMCVCVWHVCASAYMHGCIHV